MGQPYPGKWSFLHHPWTYDVHNCLAPHVVCPKAAQLAFTETGLNVSFYNIDIHAYSVLYVLPASTPDASDFSTSRFDPALELAPHLRGLFSDVQNIGHKRAGNANLFIRGSRSRSQLKSLPVSIIIFDEVDEMVQENIPLALMRQSGQNFTQDWMFSTPTIPNHGIAKYWELSTQSQWMFKCPHCSKHTNLSFPESLVVIGEDAKDPRVSESHLKCKECGHTLSHETKVEWLGRDNAKWESAFPNRQTAGFHVSQLYGMPMAQHPSRIAKAYLESLSNPAADQELYNSYLGETRVPQGSQLSDSDLDACVGTYTMPQDFKRQGVVTMGVDVGKWLHYEIDLWSTEGCRVLKVGKIEDFNALIRLMAAYSVLFTIVDSQPEHRAALTLASQLPGRIRLCIYGRGVLGKDLKIVETTPQVVVNRTSWLDESLGRFKTHTIILPKDIPMEYREHLKAPVKIYKKDSDGNPVAMYVAGDSTPDHFAHARNYSEIAFACVKSTGRSQDMTGAY